ncbi:MAG: hydrogenase expression/formation protein [Gammaproteobacteria bacterium]|nr:MAG: hydrogenase expression/formation protein [Gammaproteobacteria bacterium]
MEFKDYGRPIDIPVVGEGSQPKESGDENFNFDKPPGEMYTYDVPRIPEPDEVEDLDAAKNMLAELFYGIKGYTAGEPAIAFDISTMDAANIDLVNQVLNEGEVSVIYEGDASIHIQESVLTGIWRVRSINKEGVVVSDVIEVADIPSIVCEKTFAESTPLIADLQNLPEGVLNSPPLIIEIAEKIEEWQPGDENYVINLTLLPLSTEDLNFMGHCLGVGPITILSRGYGNCRIGSTAKKNVWWIKYYNSEDVLILNTIEVIDFPGVALAAPEDLIDSAERLKEILEVYSVVVMQ